jgi:ATP-dependent Clp protease protease subunit
MTKVIKEGIDRFFDYGLHAETRTIYIGDVDDGEIGSVTAKNAIKAIHILQSLSPEKPVDIVLNSFGGCWYNGMAIYDAIRACACQVTVTVIGCAMSMGSVVMQAADHRVIHPNATMMIHDGYNSIGDASPITFQNWAEFSKVNQQRMYRIYSERSGKPASYWKMKCASDSILTAAEAVEVGLADSIFSPPAPVPAV